MIRTNALVIGAIALGLINVLSNGHPADALTLTSRKVWNPILGDMEAPIGTHTLERIAEGGLDVESASPSRVDRATSPGLATSQAYNGDKPNAVLKLKGRSKRCKAGLAVAGLCAMGGFTMLAAADGAAEAQAAAALSFQGPLGLVAPGPGPGQGGHGMRLNGEDTYKSPVHQWVSPTSDPNVRLLGLTRPGAPEGSHAASAREERNVNRYHEHAHEVKHYHEHDVAGPGWWGDLHGKHNVNLNAVPLQLLDKSAQRDQPDQPDQPADVAHAHLPILRNGVPDPVPFPPREAAETGDKADESPAVTPPAVTREGWWGRDDVGAEGFWVPTSEELFQALRVELTIPLDSALVVYATNPKDERLPFWFGPVVRSKDKYAHLVAVASHKEHFGTEVHNSKTEELQLEKDLEELRGDVAAAEEGHKAEKEQLLAIAHLPIEKRIVAEKAYARGEYDADVVMQQKLEKARLRGSGRGLPAPVDIRPGTVTQVPSGRFEYK